MTTAKNTGRAARLLLIAAAAGMTLSGCARLRDQQGYIADQELVAAVAPGVDNRESVIQTLGRPTFESPWDNSLWYYVTRNVERTAFLPSQPVSQSILTVRFDDSGNVASVDRQEGLDQVVYFDPEDDTTPVYGRDTSLFQDIFGNIGRVSSIPTGGGPPQ